MKTLTTRMARNTPWQLLAATAAVALSALVTQVAWAAPGGEQRGVQGGYGAHGGPHGAGQRGEGHDGRRMERMLSQVNATPAQRAQIKQITDTARAEMAGQREAGGKLRQQMQALFAQPTVDANAAEALRQQGQSLREQASKRMLQMRVDISRVLTPEQRSQLNDHMQKRSEMMQRHRAERGALDQPKR